jgi:DNA-binding protein YbaB
MAFDPLPSPASFVATVLDIERRLAQLEAQLRANTFSAGTANNLQVTANGMIEVATVTIPLSAIKTVASTGQYDRVDLANRLVTIVNQAFSAAHTSSAAQCATTTGAFNLMGLCVPNGAFPNFAGFQDTANALIAEKPAVSSRIAAMRFTGQAGSVTAVVTGTLSVQSLTIGTIPDQQLSVLERDVADAINRARRGADGGIDTGIQNPGTAPPTVAMTGLCIYAHGNLRIADRVQLKGAGGTFGAVANNSGSGTTNIGTDCVLGDVWSRAPVTFADRTAINGSIRSNQGVTPASLPVPGGQTVTGQIVPNGFIVVPNLNFSVTFPGTNQGDVLVDPGHPPTTRTLLPGAWGNVTVQPQCTLKLQTGTYTFTTFDLESGATLSLDSKNGQVVIHVKSAPNKQFIFRGTIVERTGTAPKLFMSYFGTDALTLGSPYFGTFVAPDASITLATVNSPGHKGAFFAKDVDVEPIQPNVPVTFIPFSGTPSISNS